MALFLHIVSAREKKKKGGRRGTHREKKKERRGCAILPNLAAWKKREKKKRKAAGRRVEKKVKSVPAIPHLYEVGGNKGGRSGANWEEKKGCSSLQFLAYLRQKKKGAARTGREREKGGKGVVHSSHD